MAYTTLKIGSKGDEVKTLQTQLNANGYNLAVDGSFGNKTLAAVKDYQQKNNLAVDGIVGNNTWGALTKGSTATTTPTTNTATTPQQSNTYKYEEFKLDPYEDPDIVKEAKSVLEQHMGTEKSAWQTHLDDTINKILNKEEFSYDLNGDALYQQYKDQYTTQGQMARMDTMGQAAAMTGGYGNSYAQGVGQQTYQGYLQQLNDKVPELYQLALSQYNQENQDLKDQASMFANLVQQDTDEWYSMLDYYTGRADKVSSDAYTKWSDKTNMDYKIHSDKQTAGYQKMQDAYSKATTMIGLGVIPDAATLEMAGITSAEAQAMVNKVNEQAAASSSNNSGNGNKGSGYDNGGQTSSDIKKMQAALGITADGKWGSQSVEASGGLTADEAYTAWKNGTLGEGVNDYTYEETANVTNFINKIRIPHEFYRGTNEDNTKYKTYKDYVKGMLEKYGDDLTDDEIATIAQMYGL